MYLSKAKCHIEVTLEFDRVNLYDVDSED
jgi:hypothetical protein